MTEERALIVKPQEDGERIDAFLAGRVESVSRSLASSLIRAAKVTVNGRTVVRPSYRVRTGDAVGVRMDLPAALSARPENIPLTIVYQDRDLAVIDKPAGIVVHPAPGHAGGTIANALANLFPQTQGVGDEARPGIVHRLDKDTSGLMVVALSRSGMGSLQGQIAKRSADRRYLALVTGHLPQEQGTVDAPIGRDPARRKRMAVHGVAAREARTSYQVLERFSGFDLVEARLHTGRTHQIRVHLAAIGHPLAGDRTYRGAAVPGLERQFLHAYSLRLHSPSTGRELVFSSALPDDLDRVLSSLRQGQPTASRTHNPDT